MGTEPDMTTTPQNPHEGPDTDLGDDGSASDKESDIRANRRDDDGPDEDKRPAIMGGVMP